MACQGYFPKTISLDAHELPCAYTQVHLWIKIPSKENPIKLSWVRRKYVVRRLVRCKDFWLEGNRIFSLASSLSFEGFEELVNYDDPLGDQYSNRLEGNLIT